MPLDLNSPAVFNEDKTMAERDINFSRYLRELLHWDQQHYCPGSHRIIWREHTETNFIIKPYIYYTAAT